MARQQNYRLERQGHRERQGEILSLLLLRVYCIFRLRRSFLNNSLLKH